MDTQQVQDKVKSNGKWAAKEAGKQINDVSSRSSEILDQVSSRGSEILDAVQETLTDFLSNGSRSAQAITRKYPVQATLGCLAVGFVLGAWLFRSPSKAA